MRLALHHTLLRLPLALLALGCGPPDLGQFRGFEEVAADWGFPPMQARGVCLFDANGDEDLDILFTQRDGLRFFLNVGVGRFAEATDGAGLAGDLGESPAGCGAADLDGDGDRDLLVTFNRDDTVLFENDSDAHFIDVGAAWALEGWGQASVTFEDIDRDGRLDVLLAGAREGRTRLLRNLGDRFEDRTPPALLAVEHSWGGALFDIDNDGLPDLFMGTDGTEAEAHDRILHNNGDFAFEVRSGNSTITNTLSAMATPVADVDSDGFLDLYVTNIGHHPLWHNTGEGMFVDRATAAGVWGDRGETAGWASFFFDVDDDGRLDLFKANGGFSLPLGTMDNFERKARERNQLFVPRRDADPLVEGLFPYEDAARAVGLDDAGSALGGAWGDLDADGRLDLVVANLEGAPVRVYRNLGDDGSDDPGRLRLRLHARGGDPDGIGTRVRLDACGRSAEGLVAPSQGAFSQGEAVVHFGLAGCAENLDLTVVWPDGSVQESTVGTADDERYDGPLHLHQDSL